MKQQCNSFVLIDQSEFSSDNELAIIKAIRRLDQVQLTLGKRIELVCSSYSAYGGSVVRVFRDDEGRLLASYGGATRDYKWVD